MLFLEWFLYFRKIGDSIEINIFHNFRHAFLSIVIPCLRTFGNICAGDEPQTEAVIRCPGFLEKIWTLLEHTKKSVRRECIWIMSNITAGTAAQVATLFKSFPFVEKLIWFITNDSEDVRK